MKYREKMQKTYEKPNKLTMIPTNLDLKQGPKSIFLLKNIDQKINRTNLDRFDNLDCDSI